MTKATVAAVICPDPRKRDTVLLTSRVHAPFSQAWCLPGGHIDDYESVDAALKREVREETGLLFEPEGFIGWFDEIFPDEQFHAVALAFYGTGFGQLARQVEEVEEIGWFSLLEALALPLAFNHNLVLERYAALISR